MKISTVQNENGSNLSAAGNEGSAAATYSESLRNIKVSEFAGIPSNRCRRCDRALSATTSRQQGYGDVCFRKARNGDTRQSRAMQKFNPRTITDDGLARKTMQAIYRIIARLPELQKDRGMHRMGEDVLSLPLESFDSETGTIFPGFGKPQWFYLHSDRYDMAIWKLGIRDEDILAELGLPPAPAPCPAIAAAAYRRPIITEEPIPENKILTAQPIDNRIICADTQQAADEALVRGSA